MKMDNNKHTTEAIESGTPHRTSSPSKPMDDPIEPLPSDSAQLTPSEKTSISRKDSLSQEKRKWDESFTVAEKKELEGNIVKAASKYILSGDICILINSSQRTTMVRPMSLCKKKSLL